MLGWQRCKVEEISGILYQYLLSISATMETSVENSVVLNCVKWLLEQAILHELIDKYDNMVIHCDNKGPNSLMIDTLFGYFDIVPYFVANTDVLVVNTKPKSKQKNTIRIAIQNNQTQIVRIMS